MVENNFVFADLSTFNVKTAQQFYSKIFQWDYHKSDTDYHTAFYDNKEVSGLYLTPQKFQEMGMPSFWMSYIQVESVEQTVAKAKTLGGIIELVDLESAIGKIALIRDPLGAGFTVYEGNQLNSRFNNQKNALVWNELFVSDVNKVKPFYEGIFNWDIRQVSEYKHEIVCNNVRISAIQEISNDIKGKHEYWGVFFAVEDLVKTKRAITKNGGAVLYEDKELTLCTDPFEAMFHIVPFKKISIEAKGKTAIKWKAIVGLLLIGISLFSNWYWIWGLFFAAWVISDIKSGHTHMLEPISKDESRLLYWIVVLVWAIIGVYSVSYYLKPEWFGY